MIRRSLQVVPLDGLAAGGVEIALLTVLVNHLLYPPVGGEKDGTYGEGVERDHLPVLPDGVILGDGESSHRTGEEQPVLIRRRRQRRSAAAA